MKCVMSPTLYGNSVLQHVELIDVLEYRQRNKIQFLSWIVTYVCAMDSVSSIPGILQVTKIEGRDGLGTKLRAEKSNAKFKINEF